jgi:hypothetical protein
VTDICFTVYNTGGWGRHVSCYGKNSREFERVTAVLHGSLSWMLGEEKWLFGDLTGRRSERRSNKCSRAMRCGGDDNLSFGESEFLCRRNTK